MEHASWQQLMERRGVVGSDETPVEKKEEEEQARGAGI